MPRPWLWPPSRGYAALAEWLLDRGADPNKDTIGYAALHWAAGTFDTRSTHEYTTEDGEWQALAGIPNRDAKLSLIEDLLAHGADVNARVTGRMPRFGYSLGGGSITGGGSYVGATPFFLAATVGDTEIMRFLLANGADPLLSTKDRTTPLMAAAGISFVEEETSATESQLLDALKLTMQLGNDLNAANAAGATALHATAYVGFNVIAQFLVDQGAVVNARDKGGADTTHDCRRDSEVGDVLQPARDRGTAALARRHRVVSRHRSQILTDCVGPVFWPVGFSTDRTANSARPCCRRTDRRARPPYPTT